MSSGSFRSCCSRRERRRAVAPLAGGGATRRRCCRRPAGRHRSRCSPADAGSRRAAATDDRGCRRTRSHRTPDRRDGETSCCFRLSRRSTRQTHPAFAACRRCRRAGSRPAGLPDPAARRVAQPSQPDRHPAGRRSPSSFRRSRRQRSTCHRSGCRPNHVATGRPWFPTCRLTTPSHRPLTICRCRQIRPDGHRTASRSNSCRNRASRSRTSCWNRSMSLWRRPFRLRLPSARPAYRSDPRRSRCSFILVGGSGVTRVAALAGGLGELRQNRREPQPRQPPGSSRRKSGFRGAQRRQPRPSIVHGGSLPCPRRTRFATIRT